VAINADAPAEMLVPIQPQEKKPEINLAGLDGSDSDDD